MFQTITPSAFPTIIYFPSPPATTLSINSLPLTTSVPISIIHSIPDGSCIALVSPDTSTLTVLHTPASPPPSNSSLVVSLTPDGLVDPTPLSPSVLALIAQTLTEGYTNPQSGVVSYSNLSAVSPYACNPLQFILPALLPAASYHLSPSLQVSDGDLEKENAYLEKEMGIDQYNELMQRVEQSLPLPSAPTNIPLETPSLPILELPAQGPTQGPAKGGTNSGSRPVISTHPPTKTFIASLPPTTLTTLLHEQTLCYHLFPHLLQTLAPAALPHTHTYILHALTLHVLLLLTADHHPSLTTIQTLVHNLHGYLLAARGIHGKSVPPPPPPPGVTVPPKSFYADVVASLPNVLTVLAPYRDIPEVDEAAIEGIEAIMNGYAGGAAGGAAAVVAAMDEDDDEITLLLTQLELPNLASIYEEKRKTEDIIMACRRLLDEGSAVEKEEVMIFLGFYEHEVNV